MRRHFGSERLREHERRVRTRFDFLFDVKGSVDGAILEIVLHPFFPLKPGFRRSWKERSRSWGAAIGRKKNRRGRLRDRSENPATTACKNAAGAGLAGISRGFSRPAPIVLWSSKTARPNTSLAQLLPEAIESLGIGAEFQVDAIPLVASLEDTSSLVKLRNQRLACIGDQKFGFAVTRFEKSDHIFPHARHGARI